MRHWGMALAPPVRLAIVELFGVELERLEVIEGVLEGPAVAEDAVVLEEIGADLRRESLLEARGHLLRGRRGVGDERHLRAEEDHCLGDEGGLDRLAADGAGGGIGRVRVDDRRGALKRAVDAHVHGGLARGRAVAFEQSAVGVDAGDIGGLEEPLVDLGRRDEKRAV